MKQFFKIKITMNSDIVEGTTIENCHIEGILILKDTFVITVYSPKNTYDRNGLYVYDKENNLLGQTDTTFLNNII